MLGSPFILYRLKMAALGNVLTVGILFGAALATHNLEHSRDHIKTLREPTTSNSRPFI